MRFPENLQEENVIVLEMILLTLQMTVLKTNFRTSLSRNFEIILIFPKMLFSGYVIKERSSFIYHYTRSVWLCDLVLVVVVVTPLDTAQSYKSFAPS